MKFKRPSSLLWLPPLLALCCASDAAAIQFRMLAWGPHDSNLMFDERGAGVETAISPSAFSDTYEFTGQGPLVLYKRVQNEGEIVHQTACAATIPADMKKGLLLLVPGDESKAPLRKVLPDRYGTVSPGAPLAYEFFWLDDSAEARPEGTIQFINLTPRQMALRVAGKEHLLGSTKKLTLPLTPGSKRMDFQGAVQVDGEWRIFSRKPIPTRDPKRLLVILRAVAADPASDDQPSIRVVPLFDWQSAEPETDTASSPDQRRIASNKTVANTERPERFK